MKMYYYVDAYNRQVGPLQLGQLIGKITPATLVWTEGMANWMPASSIPELSVALSAPQQPFVQQPMSPYSQPLLQKPDNWLVWSILCTVLCCVPFGIVAIVYASKVNGLWDQHRYAEAFEAAKKAKTFTLIGAVSGLVVGFIFGLSSL